MRVSLAFFIIHLWLAGPSWSQPTPTPYAPTPITVQWLGMDGAVVELHWRTFVQWDFEESSSGGIRPVARVWMEYPSHFDWEAVEGKPVVVARNSEETPFALAAAVTR